ncbi:low temperature requirement protein A [Leptolyngbya sp. FACHB-671]|uniref:low temperature requirement protein A n=1 Tax=Leptolyngbya sp. FACHB-671 TaxID=2692812 RepID=UPI0016835A27|nr:low temperature requirement protein A [Leptolyngbya sp. FACHB-671]MBD2067966.1 low temperature requirement protein A [Leptolyngbya sp. FACHB-671]
MKAWFQPPRLRVGKDSEQERHATWLELFYDLVFVVSVSQLAHNLEEDISLPGFFKFIFLFIPIWWSWIGTTFYANRFDNDDIGHRLIIAGQVLAIAALAVNVHGGLGESSVGFALSYVASRLLLILEYLRAGYYIPSARPLTTRFAVGFSIGAALWVVSMLVAPPWRFVLWGIGLVIDFATPMLSRQLQLGLPPHPQHLPERFGLFTIIVLGETIIAVVNGLAEQHWDISSAIAALFGFSIAFSLWWIYFDNLSGSVMRLAEDASQFRLYQTWIYTHVPFVIGLVATGVAVEHVIAGEAGVALPTAERWLLCGSLALCFLALSLLHRSGGLLHCKARSRYRLGAAIALIVLALIGVGWSPLILIVLVAIVCAIQVVQDLYQGRPALT